MSKRIALFDIWRPGYGGASVSIYRPGTTDLADVYYDEALTDPAPNPQTLESRSDADGTNYGKFEHPLYIGSSYYINIDGIETTGIERPPIITLQGEDANAATISPNGSNQSTSIGDYVSLQVHVSLYGEWVEGDGGVPETNTETLELAIAALNTGGEVIIPAGTYKINSVSIPEGVIIRGNGRDATTLMSIIGDVSFTLEGNRNGFRDITLDGSDLSSGSIGVKAVGKNETIFDSVRVRRFETGIHFLGGKGHIWTDFSIENTDYAANIFGDTDASGSGNGGVFSDLIWVGGLVSLAAVAGVTMSFEDAVCQNINFVSVGFEDCLGIAVVINGAQSIQFGNCWWKDNVRNIDIHDDTDILTPDTSHNNDVVGVQFIGGRFFGGEFKASGTIQNVSLHDMKLEGVDFVMQTPLSNFLLLNDCYEDENVTISGESTKLLRTYQSSNGSSFGITTAASATKAWAIHLEPGQMAYLVAKVIGKGRNVAQRAVYNIGCGVYRPGATLNYDNQTANFTVGAVLRGMTSGATARIQADSDSGTTGTLTLTDIKGEFLNNEIIVDDNTTPGSADANGVMSFSNASLDTVGNTALRTAYETNASWDCAFVANGSEIELRVTGAANQTVEWTVHVDVVTT